jgi:hypothetical protein
MSTRKRNKKLFNSPISYNLEKDNGTMNMDCIIYDDTHYKRSAEKNWDSLKQTLSEHKDKHIWLNLYPLEDKQTLKSIEHYFEIDPFLPLIFHNDRRYGKRINIFSAPSK